MFLVFAMLCSVVAAGTQQWLLLILPLLVLGAVFLVRHTKAIYYLLFMTIPLSTELYFSSGLGTDLPTEQFMWILTGVGVLLFLYYGRKIPGIYILNPITLFIITTLSWTFFTTCMSLQFIISFKYFLAKFWYLVALFAMPLFFIKKMSDVELLIKLFTTFFLFSVVYVFTRHLFQGLTFETSNQVLNPFYRNHVNYACMIAVAFPYVAWLGYTRKLFSVRIIYLLMCLFLCVALYFSYTRAAIGALILIVPFYFLLRWRMIKLAVIGGSVALLLMVGTAVSNNKYLDFAPNFSKTISHQNFDDLLTATTNLEDISTMERVYRWVAGYHMVVDRPFLGFGPSNFYFFYKEYTVSSFATYVSDNDDQSGIHNYYLLLMVEQGILGCVFFLLLLVSALLMGDFLYTRLQDAKERNLIIAALSSIAVVMIISFMNDMIETDKVGAFFFLSMAMLVRGYCVYRKQVEQTVRVK